MNEYVKKAWEALFAAPGYGSILPGPAIIVAEVPDFVDNAAELTVPTDTSEINISFVDAGAANTYTIALPTSLKNIGKSMVLVIAQSADADAVCTIALTGVMDTFGSDDAANGVYVLHAVQVDGAIVWAPTEVAAIADVT